MYVDVFLISLLDAIKTGSNIMIDSWHWLVIGKAYVWEGPRYHCSFTQSLWHRTLTPNAQDGSICIQDILYSLTVHTHIFYLNWCMSSIRSFVRMHFSMWKLKLGKEIRLKHSSRKFVDRNISSQWVFLTPCFQPDLFSHSTKSGGNEINILKHLNNVVLRQVTLWVA